jgi:transcription-repair coupling factor (superfamily II helicase)
LPFKKEIIKKAITAELARNGQIYFLHNRVETINSFKKFLESFLCEKSVSICADRQRLTHFFIIVQITQRFKKDLELIIK